MRTSFINIALVTLLVSGCGVAATQRPQLRGPGPLPGQDLVADPEIVPPTAPRVGLEHLKTLQAHPMVQERMEYMLSRGRITLATSLERSVDFMPIIEEEFRAAGVPSALAYLPMVESRFLPNAVGRTAVGLWQFTRSTARVYGLRVDRTVDERRDPVKSSRAAARYLRDLYDQFESWDLALAAYNAGPGRVRQALRQRPAAGFFELAQKRLLPRITRSYVPKVLAISVIGPQQDSFGVALAQ